MPVGEILVGHEVEALRVHRIRDVHQDAVARAGAGRQARLGHHRDVVALVGDAGLLRARPVIAAGPQPGDGAGGRIREDARTGDDGGLLRGLQRHLDDVDREERGVRVFLRIEARAAGEFLARAHGARARPVDVEVVGIALRRHQRVRVRAAAGLHGRHLLRVLQVGDVEDADAAEPFDADGLRDAAGAAVETAAVLLDRHEQQVAVDRDVTLSARAGDGGDQLRLPRVFDVVGREPVEVAHHDVDALEGEVGVREVEAAASAPRGRRRGGAGRGRRRSRGGHRGGAVRQLRRHAVAGGRLRIEEAGRLPHRRHPRHVLHRLAGVLDAGLQAGTGIGGTRQRTGALLGAGGAGPGGDGGDGHQRPRRAAGGAGRRNGKSHGNQSSGQRETPGPFGGPSRARMRLISMR